MKKPTGVLVPVHQSVFDYDPQTSNAKAFLEEHPGLLAEIRCVAEGFYGHDVLDWDVLHGVQICNAANPDGDHLDVEYPNYVFIRFLPIGEQP